MRKMGFFLFALLCACSSMTNRRHSDTVPPEAIADISAANEAWLPGLRDRDAEAIAAAYAEDGLFIAPNGTVTRGRTAIVEMYRARFPRLREIVGGEVVQEGIVVVSPDLIYEWGHASLEMIPEAAGEPPAKSGGRYLTIWKKGNDGHWHIARNVAL